MRIAARIAAMLAFLTAVPAAEAATCTATIGELNFGTVDILSGGAVTTSTPVNVTCTGFSFLEQTLNTTYRICLNIGDGSGGRDSTSRTFEGSTPKLRYQLFTEGTYSTVWGDRRQSFLSVPSIDVTPSSPSGSRTLHGQLSASQQTKPPDDYVSHFTGTQTAFVYGPSALFGLLSCDGINLLGWSGGTTTATFDVKAKIEKNCLVSTSLVDFGSHGLLNSVLTDTGSVTVRCTLGTTYDVGLDNGENGTAPEDRRMKHLSQSQYVTYGLYKTSGTGSPWGNSGALRWSGTGTGLEQTIDVHGRLPAQTTPPAGTYRDHVVVTVTY